MIIQIILLIIGFVILIKGADVFVDAASSVARNFNLSKILIGLTIVAFGTSAPEFAVSISSIINESTDLLIGNVIGSNILNILLILGVSSTIYTLNVKSNTVKKELPIVILMTTLLVVLMLDNVFNENMTNMFSRSDGIVLLLFFSVFIYYLFSITKSKKEEQLDEEDKPKYNLSKSIIYTIIGIVAIIFGSEFVVKSATSIAESAGVSERLISLTIVAFGTSLPELITSIMAAIKKEADLAIGNIIGSNVFNMGIVLGLPVALFGGFPVLSFSIFDIMMLFLSSGLLYIFCRNDYKLSKVEGVIFLILFFIYYSYIFFF